MMPGGPSSCKMRDTRAVNEMDQAQNFRVALIKTKQTSFIEISIYYTIYPVKVYRSVVFSIVTDICSHPHSQL